MPLDADPATTTVRAAPNARRRTPRAIRAIAIFVVTYAFVLVVIGSRTFVRQ